jgi:hypothetical protein
MHDFEVIFELFRWPVFNNSWPLFFVLWPVLKFHSPVNWSWPALITGHDNTGHRLDETQIACAIFYIYGKIFKAKVFTKKSETSLLISAHALKMVYSKQS